MTWQGGLLSSSAESETNVQNHDKSSISSGVSPVDQPILPIFPGIVRLAESLITIAVVMVVMMMVVVARIQEAIHDVDSRITCHHIRNQDFMVIDLYLGLNHGWFVRAWDRKVELILFNVHVNVMIFEECREFKVSIRYDLAIRGRIHVSRISMC